MSSWANRRRIGSAAMADSWVHRTNSIDGIGTIGGATGVTALVELDA
jgi:hypothetical protein